MSDIVAKLSLANATYKSRIMSIVVVVVYPLSTPFFDTILRPLLLFLTIYFVSLQVFS